MRGNILNMSESFYQTQVSGFHQDIQHPTSFPGSGRGETLGTRLSNTNTRTEKTTRGGVFLASLRYSECWILEAGN